MESRREFFRNAGLAGGLGAVGALTLKKDYVKPVVKLLEPSTAYAQTPALAVIASSWTQPVTDFTLIPPIANTLTITVDLPGGSQRELIASIRRKILTLPDQTVIWPGHGQRTTVGEERLGNPYLNMMGPSHS